MEMLKLSNKLGFGFVFVVQEMSLFVKKFKSCSESIEELDYLTIPTLSKIFQFRWKSL